MHEATTESAFGALLRETVSEMEQAESEALAFDDIVQQLSLAAHLAIAAQSGKPLPRAGSHVYRTGTVTAPARTSFQLDVRY